MPKKPNLSTEPKSLPDFATEPDRRKWITEHADYFSVIWRHDGHNDRWERPTLARAELVAKRIIEGVPTARLMIYAVYGTSDTWVCNITKELK